MAETLTELDDLREEIAELRGQLKRAMKLAKRRSSGGVGIADGLARQAAQMAAGFAADFVVGRGRLLRRPVERAISNHPYGAAALAVGALLVFGRHLLTAPDE
ncbi:MAG TPA: hypothetical protein VMH36_26785 [Alphaproteobacteria bacterium]|nr:hypothetical protein [Alphaproteobacteria bacterium]